MALKDSASSSDRVPGLYKRLANVATNINKSSDELGTSVSVLDDALRGLNIGIPAWVNFYEDHDESGEYFTEHEIGYAKIGNKWGIAIRTIEGSEMDRERAQ